MFYQRAYDIIFETELEYPKGKNLGMSSKKRNETTLDDSGVYLVEHPMLVAYKRKLYLGDDIARPFDFDEWIESGKDLSKVSIYRSTSRGGLGTVQTYPLVAGFYSGRLGGDCSVVVLLSAELGDESDMLFGKMLDAGAKVLCDQEHSLVLASDQYLVEPDEYIMVDQRSDLGRAATREVYCGKISRFAAEQYAMSMVRSAFDDALRSIPNSAYSAVRRFKLEQDGERAPKISYSGLSPFVLSLGAYTPDDGVIRLFQRTSHLPSSETTHTHYFFESCFSPLVLAGHAGLETACEASLIISYLSPLWSEGLSQAKKTGGGISAAVPSVDEVAAAAKWLESCGISSAGEYAALLVAIGRKTGVDSIIETFLAGVSMDTLFPDSKTRRWEKG